jgi:tetratricopeptide (TPR) repeat protein
MRTRHFIIGLSVLLVMAACARPDTDPVETRRATSLPPIIASPELSAIDSLMWHQPDSALACLIPYFDTCRDVACNVYPENHNGNSEDVARYVYTNVAFNRHYAHLLLAELLYKNDYAQTNRPALLQAVRYFDSLTFTLNDTPSPKRLIAGTDPLSLTRNDNIVFLNARAHYINGVGYYENDSLVPACAEYLKALELMESRFDEKDLVGKKARFMTYTYNRLGDMFSLQYMMEPSIICYNDALSFYLKAPTSPTGVSRILNMIGIQYDMIGEKDTAMLYYKKAMEALPNTNNLTYRNIISSKALLSYQMSHDAQSAMRDLNDIVRQTNDENERLARYLTMGDIYFEDGQYDSALYYLEIVFEKSEDTISKIRAAEFLRTIYDRSGQKEKTDTCVQFLANHKKSDAENKAFVSELNKLFQNYLDKKKEIQVEKERKSSVLKVVKILVPLAVLFALLIIVIAKLRRGRLLKKQQTEADRLLEEKEIQHEKEMRQQQENAEKALEDKEKRHQEEIETERQAHKMQQAALSGRLKRSNEELRDMSKQLEQSLSKNALYESAASNDYAAFINDPICKHIVGIAHKQQFKSKMDYLIYKDDALSKEQLLDLRNAVQKHLPRFVSHIRRQYPKLTDNDMDCCYLVLLGLNEADISALMQRAYTTVCDRSRKISRIIGANDSLYHALRNMLDE